MSDRSPRTDANASRPAAKAEKLTAHRGLATWGERLVPLDEFRRAASASGRRLTASAREQASQEYLQPTPDPTPVEGPFSRVVVFGGVYNNAWALEALLEEAARRRAEAVFCLGDLGGFGPRPNLVQPLLEQGSVLTIKGNYEDSLATGHEDCNCGYTDPRDNHFAKISYRYTAQGTSPEFKGWMGTLPARRRIRIANRELLLVHGSPRRINEFLFESTSPIPFLESILDREVTDGLLCTHTGLDWHRRLPSGRDAINVGVIGRPANDGSTDVRYCWLEDRGGTLEVESVRLAYDHEALAREMRREDLPAEFVDTILTGWWTTCLEILPAKERARSRY